LEGRWEGKISGRKRKKQVQRNERREWQLCETQSLDRSCFKTCYGLSQLCNSAAQHRLPLKPPSSRQPSLID
jgi:hypothetical protein